MSVFSLWVPSAIISNVAVAVCAESLLTFCVYYLSIKIACQFDYKYSCGECGCGPPPGSMMRWKDSRQNMTFWIMLRSPGEKVFLVNIYT